jgi:ribosomal protein S3AE
MAKAKARIVTKKKQWVKIVAPAAFEGIELGETYVNEKKEVIGKKISVNIMNISRGYRRQNIDVSFEVTGMHEDKAVTEFIGYQIIPSSTKRMVRRGKNKISDSFVAKTADNKFIKIKPILVTRSKTNGSVQTLLRKSMRQYLAGMIAKQKLDDFAKEVVAHRIQKGMFHVAAKIFPLSVCEIRWLHVTKEKNSVEKVKEMQKAKEEPEGEEPIAKADKPAEEIEKKQIAKEEPEGEKPIAKAETKVSDEVEENAKASN